MAKRLFLVVAATFCFVNATATAGAGSVTVTKARIGCLDIQTDGNLTGLVGRTCNNKAFCSCKAPTDDFVITP